MHWIFCEVLMFHRTQSQSSQISTNIRFHSRSCKPPIFYFHPLFWMHFLIHFHNDLDIKSALYVLHLFRSFLFSDLVYRCYDKFISRKLFLVERAKLFYFQSIKFPRKWSIYYVAILSILLIKINECLIVFSCWKNNLKWYLHTYTSKKDYGAGKLNFIIKLNIVVLQTNIV